MSDQTTNDPTTGDANTGDANTSEQPAAVEAQDGATAEGDAGAKEQPDNIRAQHYASAIHPFLTVFIPFWFVLTIITVMVNSAIIQSGTRIFPPFYVVLLLLVGVSETITGNMLYKERIAGMLPRLREFVFIVIFGLFFLLLFHGDIARGDFNIGRLKIWLPMLILAIEWFMSYYVHQKLRERELFLKFFTGKPEKEVRDVYNAYMHEGGESLKAIKSLKRFIIALTVIGFLMLNVMTWGFRFNFTGLRLFIILVFFAGNIFIVALLNTWTETQFTMMDGLVVTRSQRRFRAGVILLLFIALLLFAIPMTGSRPMLPESYIAAFFNWLQQIGRFEPPDVEVEPPEITFAEQDYDTGEYLGRATGSLGEESQVLANITRIIGWILLVAFGVAAVVFLLLPILRRSGGKAGIKGAMAKAIANLRVSLQRMRASFTQMLETIRNRRKSRVWNKIRKRGEGGRLQQTLERAASRMGLSRKERKINNRMLRAFFRFTRWGEKRGVPFQTSMGAWEYATRVEAATPEVNGQCVELADMFEEALYSDHEIEESFRSSFYDKVKQVTKVR